MDDGAILLLQFFFLALFGFITAFLAHQRGRNAVGWFFIGMIGGCLGLILVLVLPDLNQQNAERQRDEREKRRLREQLAQERMKNEAFRGHTTTRLDVHDEALGMDTRSVAPDPELAPPSPPAAIEGGVPVHDWYVAVPGGQPEGPLALDAVRDRVRSGAIGGRTLVWHSSLEDWLPLEASPLHILL